MVSASLVGWTVGVTADRRAQEQIELLERRGARTVHGPTIQTMGLHENRGLRDATKEIIARPPAFVVLTTGVGVRAWFDAADALGCGDELVGALRETVVIARGPKAAGAALTAGVEVAWQAPDARSDQLVDHLARAGAHNQRVAVQLDGRTEPVLAAALGALGADVVAVPVYRWTIPEPDEPARRLVEAACARQLDAVTFTSAPALANMLTIADRMGCRNELLRAFAGSTRAVSIGSVCTDAARSFGVEPAIEPARHRLGAMVMSLARHARDVDRVSVVHVGARRVLLRASAVVVDDVAVELPPRERALCAVLLDRPGTVVSKGSLLQRAWRGESVEGHAVEAAVGRLRKRLHGALTITAIARRGYRLTDS